MTMPGIHGVWLSKWETTDYQRMSSWDVKQSCSSREEQGENLAYVSTWILGYRLQDASSNTYSKFI